MSEYAPEDQGGGGGGFMSQRWFGIPAPLVIVGVALIAYFLFFRGSGGGGTSTAGGPDTQTVGDTTIDTGAVQVSVNTGSTNSNDTTLGDNDQPGPPPVPKTTTVTVPRVIGEPAGMARRRVTRRGLEPAGITQGRVRTENPAAGTKVKKGSTVTLGDKGANP